MKNTSQSSLTTLDARELATVSGGFRWLVNTNGPIDAGTGQRYEVWKPLPQHGGR